MKLEKEEIRRCLLTGPWISMFVTLAAIVMDLWVLVNLEVIMKPRG